MRAEARESGLLSLLNHFLMSAVPTNQDAIASPKTHVNSPRRAGDEDEHNHTHWVSRAAFPLVSAALFVTQIALGFVGLMVLLIFFYLPAWEAYRFKDFFYLGFISLFTLVCTTESAMESQKGVVFFAIFNSLLVFQYAKLKIGSFKRIAYG